MSPLHSGVSRRKFVTAAAGLSVAYGILPYLTEADLAWAAVPSASQIDVADAPPNIAVLNGNEYPDGPIPAAAQAAARLAVKGNRYYRGEVDRLASTICATHSIDPKCLALYPGSSDPLHFASMAFTSPSKPLICADPTFELAPHAAAGTGAKVHFVPLKEDRSHDLQAMVAKTSEASLIYVCNPNNPTGTTTSKGDIIWAHRNKPAGSILLVDEAYIHFSNAETVLDLATSEPDVMVLRTFSKIFGMAGMRCGFAVAQPDLLAKLRPYGQNPIPTTAAVAARVSLLDRELIPARKKANAEVRDKLFAWLTQHRFAYWASDSNCFLLDMKRDNKTAAAAMAEHGVYIGRSWPIMPTYARITIGSDMEMMRFKKALIASRFG